MSGGHYDLHYGAFGSPLHAAIRHETFGDDFGQTSWLTSDEHDLFIAWLALAPGDSLLEVACGSGGPALRIARRTGCSVRGLDLHEAAIAEARRHAAHLGLERRASFECRDASAPLPDADAAYDALVCIDAVNHLPDRERTLGEWARVLKPGGRLVYTDPVVVTGPVSKDEIAARAAIGFFLFLPPGENERLLEAAGFDRVAVHDRSANLALIAGRWRAARQRREEDLRRLQGDEGFEREQRFYEVAARVAAEGRLSRFAYHAVRSARPGDERRAAA